MVIALLSESDLIELIRESESSGELLPIMSCVTESMTKRERRDEELSMKSEKRETRRHDFFSPFVINEEANKHEPHMGFLTILIPLN